MNNHDFLDMFLDEAEEQLETMNRLLLVLEKSPDDSEAIAELFRMAHSLKGAAASLGFNNIATLTHETETLMDVFRSGTAKLTSDSCDTLYRSIEALEALVREVEKSGKDEGSVAHVIGELKNCAIGLKAAAAPRPLPVIKTEPSQYITKTSEAIVSRYDDISPRLLENPAAGIGEAVETELRKGRNVYEIVAVVDENEEMPDMRALVLLGRIKEFSRVLDYYPDIENENVGYCRHFNFLVSTDRSEESVRAAIGDAGIEKMIFFRAPGVDENAVDSSNAAATSVLVIDDSRYFRNKMGTLLRRNGFEVTEAEDAIEGLYACKKGRFDMALLDINMPYMQGLEALAFLSKMDHGMKIIMMSTIDDEKTILRAIRSGARDYIVKPFNPANVLMTIDRILGHASAAM